MAAEEAAHRDIQVDGCLQAFDRRLLRAGIDVNDGTAGQPPIFELGGSRKRKGARPMF